MVDALQNLQVVYAKWEERNPHLPGIKRNDSALMNWRQPSNNLCQSMPLHRSSRSKGHSRYRNGFENVDTLSVDLRNLAWFKSQPVALPFAVRQRPFSAHCCKCMPESRNSLFSDGYRSAGLRNILRNENKYCQSNWWSRTFCDVSFVMERRLIHCYPDVSMAVLTSKRLLKAIHSSCVDGYDKPAICAPQANDPVKNRLEKRAKSLLRKMSARISNRLIRFTGWFLQKFLGCLLSAILVHKGQMAMLQKACNSGLPVIFLPTHRSHLDYILITFILFHYDINAPHVAAGDNLIIPFFESLMRGLGGFFIRRKLDRSSGCKDHIYRAVLHTYMEELLHHGEFIEFFIEGQRTRSGKAVYPRNGLLSVIVDSFLNDVVDDVFIVPVSMSYDKLVDGNFTKEQMGEPKVYETFWRAVIAIYHVLMGHYGAVRVDFSQPFSLKEYVKVCAFFPEIDERRSLNDSLHGDIKDKSTESSEHSDPLVVVHRIGESSMDLVSGDSQHIVLTLAEHVVYNSVRVQSIMSTQLLASLLLYGHRKGLSVCDLISAFDSLKLEVLSREHDVGFAGETIDVITHALNMLGSHVVKMEPSIDISLLDDEQLSLVKVVPVTTLPHIFELSYHAHAASAVFAVESVVANVIYSIIGREKLLNMENCSVSVSKNQLMTQATELCSILKYDYIFIPPCQTLEIVLNDAIEQLVNSEVLLINQEQSDSNDADLEDQIWAKRMARGLDCGFEDSDDESPWTVPDEIFFLNEHADLLEKLWFLKRILSPFLETYYVAACRLTVLLEEDVLESVFVSSLHALLKDRVASDETCYAESAALDTVKNATSSFRNMRLIDCYEVAGVRMLTLVLPYSDENVLNSFIRHLESYRE